MMFILTVFQVLVGSAIVFRKFLIKTFLHFVHMCLFIILRSEVPNTKAPRSGRGHLSTCVGWGSVWVSRPLLRERSSYATLCGRLCLPPSPSEMRHVLVLACTSGGKKNGKR